MDLQTELDLLDVKRKALQQGLHMASLIERLNHGLKATLIAKRPGSSLPTEAMQYYERLDVLSRALPTPLLKQRIPDLGHEVQQDFDQLLLITRLVKGVDQAAGATSAVTDVDRFLSRFRDRSSRLVGLRVALYKRGEGSGALKLSLPKELLQRRLQVIGDLERHCRHKIRNEIKSLKQDVGNMLAGAGITDSVRGQLRGLLEDLQAALQYLETGGEIGEIPVMVKTLEWDPAPISAEELAGLLKGQEVEELPVEEITISTPAQMREPAFRDTLHYWLNTPVDVSWDEIRRRQKRKGN